MTQLERTRASVVMNINQSLVGIHLDDFDTGYSSISVLRGLPVTGARSNLRFVHDLMRRRSGASSPLPAAPPSGMLGSVQPCERARRLLMEAYAGKRTPPASVVRTITDRRRCRSIPRTAHLNRLGRPHCSLNQVPASRPYGRYAVGLRPGLDPDAYLNVCAAVEDSRNLRSPTS
jgi:hypothetical protein